jgi:voltage-gated potassium channel
MSEAAFPAEPKAPRKYLYLLISIAFLICVFPFAHENQKGVVLLQAVFLAVMGAAILAVRRSGRNLAVALGLGIPAICARLVNLFTPTSHAASFLLAAIVVVFFFWVLVVLIMDVFAGGSVSSDKICGAICVYFIIGISWSVLFGFLELAEPGSFIISTISKPEVRAGLDPARAAADGFSPMGSHDLPTIEGSYFTYLSFITLTSVGYGDVLPVSHAARTFSWLEAVVGQLYLTILVARLVGLHLVKHSLPGP